VPQDLIVFAEKIYSHPEYNQNWDALLFFGGAAFDLSFTDMFHYVNTVGKDPRRLLGATAIISPSMLHFGIGRMYAGTVGDRLGKLRIERKEEPALAWLKKGRS
jgi:hypothetical protein